MQRTAVSWVIYSLTHSAYMLGITVFAQQFPSFLLSLFGGIAADRYNRYRILLITQIASMIQAVLLAVLTLTHHDATWPILALSAALGVINAFDVPARQPMVHEMINNKDDLPNALSLNSAMVNMARLVGPALSGIVLQQLGAGVCFAVNAASFVAVITSLLLMKVSKKRPITVNENIGADLSEGIGYLKSTPAISMILLLLMLVSLLVLPYNTLLPVFAKVVFKGDAATFGYINSFIGFGALVGTFILASLKPGTNLKTVLLVNNIVLGLSLILFSQLNNFPLAMVAVVICGYATMSQTTVCITIVQVESDKSMRGRVMSYVALGYFGMLPIGSLLIGAISQHTGAANALLVQGILALVIAAVFYRFLTSDKTQDIPVKAITKQEIN